MSTHVLIISLNELRKSDENVRLAKHINFLQQV